MSKWRAWRAFRIVLAGCAILGAGALLPAPALASEGIRPLIGPVTVGGYASGEGVVEAQISPEGHETTYKITLDCPGQEECEHTEGLLPGHGEYTVSLKLTSLQEGSTYRFNIYASSTAGGAVWQGEFYVQPIPPGSAPNGKKDEEVYRPPGLSQSDIEDLERGAARTVQEAREQQQAKEAAAAKEQEQAKAREAAVLASEEAARKDREEAAQSSAPACVVPALRGDTLSAARRALTKAHCRLGKVSRPPRHSSTLLVTRQSVRHGKKLPAGAAVAVTLGSAHRPSA